MDNWTDGHTERCLSHRGMDTLGEGPLDSEVGAGGRGTDRLTCTQVEIPAERQPDKAENLPDSQVDRQGGHRGDPID